MEQLMTLCVLKFRASSFSEQSYETAQAAFDARAWEEAAKLARAEAIKGNANSQVLLGQLYHFEQGSLPKSSELAVIWYSISISNGITAIEELYNGAAFVFNEEQLQEIEAKATTCLSSQYKNCD